MGTGQFLRDCRKSKGFSQSELADVLNLSQSDISKIETDRRIPDTHIFRDWTVATQSMDLGIAFLYGTELLTVVPDILNTMSSVVVGFIHFFY
ncbi:helix-turn-helix transcriptional regulator [Sporosarcina sp. FSL K6-1522]|uniref:helix-turn-helix domain-containing protein n=1 Tax=Sporosarcina sp. FSL K6-1522 TaxID=2921554 RepID=UPI00315AC697